MGDTSSEGKVMSANGGSRWIPDGTRRVSVVFCWTVDCNTLRFSGSLDSLFASTLSEHQSSLAMVQSFLAEFR